MYFVLTIAFAVASSLLYHVHNSYGPILSLPIFNWAISHALLASVSRIMLYFELKKRILIFPRVVVPWLHLCSRDVPVHVHQVRQSRIQLRQNDPGVVHALHIAGLDSRSNDTVHTLGQSSSSSSSSWTDIRTAARRGDAAYGGSVQRQSHQAAAT